MQQLPSILTPDVGLIFWMLIAFLIIFVLVARYGFPVIIKMVESRKQYIDESLTHAREANEKLAHIKAEGEAILKEARQQQAQILKEAMAARDGILQDAREKAQAQGRQLLEDAKAQIAAEKEKALREIRGSVADISVQIAEKVVRRQLNETTEQQRYIETLLNEMVPESK
jgi:F-type H+-transporting ATPase subunit b